MAAILEAILFAIFDYYFASDRYFEFKKIKEDAKYHLIGKLFELINVFV